MTTKHTLLSLCDTYDKIEIPIIQRDYAQGREEQEKLRDNFVNHLVDNLLTQTPLELDFVYGNEREDIDKGNKQTIRTFIPIDGQQRLTTLWLLHWFLAIQEENQAERIRILSNFTYETRPSAHTFCKQLMEKDFPKDSLTYIKEYIINQEWFDDEWLRDATVKGMLEMLHTFSEKEDLLNGKISFKQASSIAFYFVPLLQFGLSEDLYIRMNARGKILTSFENFKSEFYKILADNNHLEEVKDKMEYEWVSHLWNYRKNEKVFVIDDCFMSYLAFVTRMLYFRQEKARNEDGYEQDFLDFKVLKRIYTDIYNVDYLIFAFDNITELSNILTTNLLFKNSELWLKSDENSKLSDLLSSAIKGENLTIDKQVILYAALMYMFNHKGNYKENIIDFVKVVRNLIYNTGDKSERDLPTILKSIDTFAKNKEVYKVMLSNEFKLEGFRNSQCEEEHIKALIINRFPSSKKFFQTIEDDACFAGNISSILVGLYVSTEEEFEVMKLTEESIFSFDLAELEKVYSHYKIIAKDDFKLVWGDLLNTCLYTHEEDIGRMIFDRNSSKNPAIILLAKSFAKYSSDNLEEFLEFLEKKTIRLIFGEYESLSEIRDVKKQLYLLYVLTLRVMKKTPDEFFKNGWHIGWLTKENGFCSCFTSGIEKDPNFSKVNPIFQTYYYQFRYNLGLQEKHALPPEIVGGGRSQKPWEKLREWVDK